MRGIPKLAVKKPATTLMLVITMIVVGALSIVNMPIELLPNFNIPVVTVSTLWIGAVPEDIDKLVTRKIEDAVTEVEGVKDFYSFSDQGISNVVVNFDYGVDVDSKVDLIQSEIDKIRSELPDDIEEPITDKVDAGGEAAIMIDLSGRDLSELRSYSEDIIKPRFQKIKGVGQVNISGGLEKEILVEIDPYKLSSYGMDVETLYNIVGSSSINIPVGSIKSGGKKYLVKLEGETKSLEQVSNIVLLNDSSGLIRLKDVARVVLTSKEPDSFYRVNGEDAISILISKTDDGNAVEISKAIKKDMEELQLYIPRGSKLSVSFDSSKYIEQSISTVQNNAITGLILSSIILFIFLKSFKTTLVIALAIPTSIMVTFALMSMKGINLNVISLMGLALGVGMLVDNSVVVLDNIFRHYKELKKKPLIAASEGASEIAIPIASSTATSVAVFIPLVLRDGLAKEIFSDMSYTITFSLLASLVVALTFVPMSASKFLQSEPMDEKKSPFLDLIKDFYVKVLFICLSHRWKVILLTIFLFISSLFLAGKVGGEFFPKADESQYTIIAELPSGLEIDYAQNISTSLEEFMVGEESKNEMLRYSVTGQEDRVSINVELKEKKDRSRNVFSIVENIRSSLEGIPDINLNFSTAFKGPEGSDREFQFEVYSTNYKDLKDISSILINEMKKNNGLADIKSSVEGGGPQAKVIIDRDRLQSYGLRVSQVGRALSYQILGDNPITIKTDIGEIDVTLQLAREFRRSLDKILESRISIGNGESIPLSEVASIEVEEGASTIERKNKIRQVSLGANFTDGYTQREAQIYMEEAFIKLNLPKNITYGFGGEGEMLNDTMADLNFAIVLSIFLVYFILVSQFESFITPFIIVLTVPLSIIGVFYGLFLSNIKLSIMVMVGIIMLVGIVVNNAIVLIDYINILRDEGYDLIHSIKLAGKTRLRPILMTTITTVFGMIPLALSRGEGAEMYNGMAVSVIFGLSTSTLLTLVVVPILYTLFSSPRKIKNLKERYNR